MKKTGNCAKYTKTIVRNKGKQGRKWKYTERNEDKNLEKTTK